MEEKAKDKPFLLFTGAVIAKCIWLDPWMGIFQVEGTQYHIMLSDLAPSALDKEIVMDPQL